MLTDSFIALKMCISLHDMQYNVFLFDEPLSIRDTTKPPLMMPNRIQSSRYAAALKLYAYSNECLHAPLTDVSPI